MLNLPRLSKLQLFLIGLLIVAAFLRLYNLPNTLQFQGDQGRDSLIVSRIFTDRDPVFIGPVTSVGNMYLGPLYYYFMLPFLWLSYPSPMGPVYAVALLGIVTVWLLYALGKKLVGERAALIATTLYTFSWITITYTRFSWNPNPAPLVSLIMMYATYLAWQKNSWWWVVVMGMFAVLLQLHYLAMLSAGGAGIIWLIDFYHRWRQPKKRLLALKDLLLPTLLGAMVVVASFAPLMLFDYKHQWLNATAFQKLVFKEENFKVVNSDSFGVRVVRSIKEMHGRGMHILFEITIGHIRALNNILLISLVGLLTWLWKKAGKRKTFYGEAVLGAYLATGIIGTALYEHTVFDHYIAYLYPTTFLLLGVGLGWLWKRTYGKLAVVAFIIHFLIYNIPRIPIQTVGWTFMDMKAVSDSIYQRVKPGEKYNIVLMSDTGDIDAQNYRYFLNTTDRPPVRTEQRGEVETLFIINEDKKLTKVTDSPIYEIVVFPNKQPTEVYAVLDGPEVTVLKTSSPVQ